MFRNKPVPKNESVGTQKFESFLVKASITKLIKIYILEEVETFLEVDYYDEWMFLIKLKYKIDHLGNHASLDSRLAQFVDQMAWIMVVNLMAVILFFEARLELRIKGAAFDRSLFWDLRVSQVTFDTHWKHWWLVTWHSWKFVQWKRDEEYFMTNSDFNLLACIAVRH